MSQNFCLFCLAAGIIPKGKRDMKSQLLLGGMLLLSAGSWSSLGKEQPRQVELKGIVGIGAAQFALLEATQGISPPGVQPMAPLEMMLVPGQSDGGIEVVSIDAPGGKVKIRNAGEMVELVFSTNEPPGILVAPFSATATGEMAEEVRFLRLQHPRLSQVFSLYQIVAHRTLLRPSTLPVAFGPDLYSMEAV